MAFLLTDLQLHHVGVVTADLERAVRVYGAFGGHASERFDDPIQQVRICLVRRESDPLVELIMPTSAESPARAWLGRIKAGPYHTCYRTEDLDAAVEELRHQGMLPASEPHPAVAFGGRRVIFLWSRDIGLLELIE